MSPEFVHKYMQTAKVFGQVKNACHSRKIGAVIVNPVNHCIVGAGYNSPPKHVPHCNTNGYIRRYFLPKINENENYADILVDKGYWTGNDWDVKQLKADFCSACPRKIMGFKAGEASEICTCAHAERNAITNKTMDSSHCYMFAYCCFPCRDCASMIVNAGISRVYIADKTVYHADSVNFFIDASVEVFYYEEDPLSVTKLNLEELL